MTEVDYCPMTGDTPGRTWPFELRHPRRPPGPDAILMPGRIVHMLLSPEDAEHQRAMMRALSWSHIDGKTYFWVER